jgi:HEAT repeat protein
MESPDVERLERERDVDGLITALHGSAADVREAAATSLGRVGDGRAVQVLIRILSELHAEVQAEKERWTRDQWGRTASQPPQGLPQGSLATSVIRSLGELGDERAIAAILEWEPLKRDYVVSVRTRHALSVFDYPAGAYRKAAEAMAVGEPRFPLEDACIDALRNIDGDEARVGLSRFGVQVRHLP